MTVQIILVNTLKECKTDAMTVDSDLNINAAVKFFICTTYNLYNSSEFYFHY